MSSSMFSCVMSYRLLFTLIILCVSFSCLTLSCSEHGNHNEVTSDSSPVNYGLLLLYDKESCKIKAERNVLDFFHTHAKDYPTLEIQHMTIDSDGTPRILIFSNPQDRDRAVIDGSKLSEEEIRAILRGEAPPAPKPLATIMLGELTVNSMHAKLKEWNLPRTFPTQLYGKKEEKCNTPQEAKPEAAVVQGAPKI